MALVNVKAWFVVVKVFCTVQGFKQKISQKFECGFDIIFLNGKKNTFREKLNFN